MSTLFLPRFSSFFFSFTLFPLLPPSFTLLPPFLFPSLFLFFEGGTILHAAHLDLETLTMDREVMRIRDGLSLKYAELVYNGYWFSPEMDFLNNAMDHAQVRVHSKHTAVVL